VSIFLPKVKIEIVLDVDQVDGAIEAIVNLRRKPKKIGDVQDFRQPPSKQQSASVTVNTLDHDALNPNFWRFKK